MTLKPGLNPNPEGACGEGRTADGLNLLIPREATDRNPGHFPAKEKFPLLFQHRHLLGGAVANKSP